jgi:hypothetical protein
MEADDREMVSDLRPANGGPRMNCSWCGRMLDPAVEATIVERYDQAAVVAGSEPIEAADRSTTGLVHSPADRPPGCAEPAGSHWLVIGTVLPHLFPQP